MYPWIPWELVAGPFGSAEHTLGSSAFEDWFPDFIPCRNAWSIFS